MNAGGRADGRAGPKAARRRGLASGYLPSPLGSRALASPREPRPHLTALTQQGIRQRPSPKPLRGPCCPSHSAFPSRLRCRD